MMWSVPVFRTKYLKPFQQNQHRITRISNITKNPKNNKLQIKSCAGKDFFGKKFKTVFEMHPFLVFYLYHAEQITNGDRK